MKIVRTPWLATWLGAAVLTVHRFVDLGLPGYEVALFISGVFIGAEWMSAFDGVPDNTKSEGVWDNVAHPLARWALGVWLAYVVGTHLSGWLAVGLAIWLPLHFAIEGIERKVFGR